MISQHRPITNYTGKSTSAAAAHKTLNQSTYGNLTEIHTLHVYVTKLVKLSFPMTSSDLNHTFWHYVRYSKRTGLIRQVVFQFLSSLHAKLTKNPCPHWPYGSKFKNTFKDLIYLTTIHVITDEVTNMFNESFTNY